MSKKFSDFITKDVVTDSDFVNVTGKGANRRVSWPDFLDNIYDRIVTPFIYPTIVSLQEAPLRADEDDPVYVRVEETEYQLYKITNIAPGASDIVLDNGNTATAQTEYRDIGFVVGPDISEIGALATYNNLTGTLLANGPLPSTVGVNFIEFPDSASDGYFRKKNDNTLELLTGDQLKTNLSLNNVDNTSDLNKPISTATQTALDLKAPLASPALTGTPTAPTAAADTNTTQIATTAFVQGELTDRIQSVATIADLKALTGLNNGALIEATDNGLWEYDSASSATVNEARGVALPDTLPGRFIAQANRVGIPNEHTIGGVVQNIADYASFSSNLLPSFASLTKTNFDASGNHTAGTVGEMSGAIELDTFSYYLLKVSVSTTTSGRINFKFGTADLISDVPTGYYFSSKAVYTNGIENNRIMDSTTFWFMFDTSTVAHSGFQILTDTSWAGQLSDVELYSVTERKFAFAGAGTGSGVENPVGLKAGAYNRNDVAVGDKFTLGAFVGTDGVSPQAAHNTATGAKALGSLLYGDQNNANGPYVFQYLEGSNNDGSGYSAGKLTTKGQENVYLGYKSSVSNTIGSKNVSVGFHSALLCLDSSEYVAIGWQAGKGCTTGDQNVNVGGRTGMGNLTGNGNTNVGTLAGFASGVALYDYDNTVCVGYQTTTYGDNSIAIGNTARVGDSSTPTANSVSIGNGVVNVIANTTKIGNAHNVTALSGRLTSKNVYSGVTAGAGTTYTASQFFGNVIERSSPGAPFSDTTPTAADLLALIPAPEVGMGYDLYIRNLTASTLTLVAGSGVTLSGTTTIAGAKTRLYKVRVNTISPAAVGVYGIASYDN